MLTQQSDGQKRITSPLPRGYIARPAKSEDDEAVAELRNAHSMAVIGKHTTAVEEIRLDWGLPGFDIATSTRAVFGPDGKIAGYMEVWDISDQIRMRTRGCVHPKHSGLGIASHLIEWAEVRARQSIPKAPEGARVVLLNQVLSKDESAHSVLSNYGYESVRHFFRMEIRFDKTPPSPEWPDGIAVRTFVCDQDEWPTIEAIHEAFRDHWGHVDESPEEAAIPWLQALAKPRLSGFSTMVSNQGNWFLTNATEPSVLPLSTTITSKSLKVCRSSERRHSPRKSFPFRLGMTTETQGPVSDTGSLLNSPVPALAGSCHRGLARALSRVPLRRWLRLQSGFQPGLSLGLCCIME